MTTDPKAATHGGGSARPGGAANAGARRPSPAGSQTRTAFTLIEVMVAVSIMAILVVIMSAIFHQSSVAWDSGTGRMKANVTARAVLNLMETELSHAVASELFRIEIDTRDASNPQDIKGYTTMFFWTLGTDADTTNRMARRITYWLDGDCVKRSEERVPIGAGDYTNGISNPVKVSYNGQDFVVLATNVVDIKFHGWPEMSQQVPAVLTQLPRGVKIRLKIGRADRVSNLAVWSAGPDGKTRRSTPNDPVNADDIGSW